MSEPQRYVWQGLARDELTSTVTTQRPPEHRWGFFGSDDFALSAAGMHIWFGTLKELCAFLVEGEPLIYEFEGDELEQLQAAIRPVAGQLANGDLSPADALEPLNDALKGVSCIEWIGTFDDLASGSSEYARMARAEYRDLDDEEDPSALPAIAADELDAFADFAAEWRAG